MSGTHQGGLKAALTNKQIHGKDFYKHIGSIGGKVCNPYKGFGKSHEHAVACGRKGRKQRNLNNEYKKLIIKFNMLGIWWSLEIRKQATTLSKNYVERKNELYD